MGLNKVYAPPQGKYSSNLGKVGEYQRQYSGCNLNIHIFDFRKKYVTSIKDRVLFERYDYSDYSIEARLSMQLSKRPIFFEFL